MQQPPITFLVLAWVVILSGPLGARESTDIVVMNNGDRLTCTIKRLEAGVLYVGLDYADGDVSLDWKKIASIESKQLFIVTTESGSVMTGKIAASATPGAKQPIQFQILEAAPESTATIEMSQVVNVRQTSEQFLKQWSGDVSAGMAYTKGNNATQYNFGFDTTYQRERWAAQTGVSSNLAANNGAKTSTRNSLSLSTYRLLPWENYFYESIGGLLQSSVQGIRLQTSLGGGIGRFFRNTNHSRFTLMGGLAWQNTNYHQSDISQPAQNVAAGLIAANLSLFRFSKTKLDINAQVFPAISEPGRVRFNANTSYFVKLIGDISWTLTFYGNWDTKPPPHFSGSDYGTTSGLSWDFGK